MIDHAAVVLVVSMSILTCVGLFLRYCDELDSSCAMFEFVAGRTNQLTNQQINKHHTVRSRRGEEEGPDETSLVVATANRHFRNQIESSLCGQLCLKNIQKRLKRVTFGSCQPFRLITTLPCLVDGTYSRDSHHSSNRMQRRLFRFKKRLRRQSSDKRTNQHTNEWMDE